MILFTAKIVYGSAENTRKFVEFENACKWLYSHAVGQMFINGVEYTRNTLKNAILKVGDKEDEQE